MRKVPNNSDFIRIENDALVNQSSSLQERETLKGSKKQTRRKPMPPNGRNAAILFTSSPSKEQKRFSPLLPKEANQEIAANLLFQALKKLHEFSESEDFDLLIVSDNGFNANLATRFNGRFMLHRGRTFIQRIGNAMKDGFFLGYEKITLVGNDCPLLSNNDFNKSFKYITDTSVVFGPAKDGGIYLVGLPRNILESKIALDKLPWRSHDIMNDLISCFTSNDYDAMLLREKEDLDNIADLANFIHTFDSSDDSFL